uniref:Uncharacterized protein n=1 Tax=Clastoptera arizonana TaxID=38151 RepID=A0A1B6D7E5_9HEMI
MSDVKSALSHGFLAVSSGWALSKCMDLHYAAFGFGLYLVNGILGVACYAFDNESLNHIQIRLYRISTNLSLPLIATEMYISAGLPYQYCWLHLVFPIYFIIKEEVLDEQVDSNLKDISNIAQIISAGYSSFLKDNNIYGYAFAVLQCANFFGNGRNQVLQFCCFAGLGCISALFFFKGSQF